MKTLVMKFGGAAVATPERFGLIAEMIVKRREEYDQIAVVVSAMSGTTNRLIEMAHKVHPEPPRREYDMLVSVGERVSISLLAMALSLRGVEAISFTGSQSGIITCDVHSEARILEVRPHRLTPPLNQGKVVIVAGFQGVSQKGEITTLGRGGSDTTAVALGLALNAEHVEFYKDVPGVFSADPKICSGAVLHRHLSYEACLEIGGKVLHSRCVALAKRNGLPLKVFPFEACSSDGEEGTLIGSFGEGRNCSPLYEEAC